MTLIKSISGIRGTIGGKPSESLSPLDVVKYTAAFATFIYENSGKKKMVVGRDARISGQMVEHLVIGTLISMGFEVVNLGLSTTPTVEIAVPDENAGGGIILTASHNPKEWNALKLLNHLGEFISEKEGQKVLKIAEKEKYVFADVNDLGSSRNDDSYFQKHIDKILALPLVDKDIIAKKEFKIVVDGINSTGSIVVPMLLKQLGVKEVVVLNETPNGKFAHNPEPLPEHLVAIANEVKHKKFDLGIVVDPDVDRLCFVTEEGQMFGEEYTLVAIADYILQNKKGNSVSNLSSTTALKDITVKHGGEHFGAAVGEVNVVALMKEKNAVIGGEGNGGIIYPELHYGRDALVGIALFLTHLAKSGKTTKLLRNIYPDYVISKNKITLTKGTDVDVVLEKIADKYKNEDLNNTDGLKITMSEGWVHLRKSNTEPIIRVYAESRYENIANNMALKIMKDIQETM
ncbi:MAG: phosphoglucosamine mutase [Bacteroidota bacterium]